LNKRTGRERLKLLLKVSKNSLPFLLLAVICSYLQSNIEMMIPQVTRLAVDSVIGTDAPNADGLIAKLLELSGGVDVLRDKFWVLAIAIVVLAAGTASFRFLSGWLNSLGSDTLLFNLRTMLFSHIQKLPFAWHMKNKTGDIIQRCTSDVEMVNNFVTAQLVGLIRTATLLTLTISFMLKMDLRLTAVALATLPVIAGYSIIFGGKMRKGFRECDESEGVLSAIAQENLTGVRVVRAFGRERHEVERFHRQNVIYTDKWVNFMRIQAIFWACGDLISGLQVMTIIVLGSVFCARGTLSAGEFIAFVSYNAMLIWPVRSLGRTIGEMSKAGVSIDRMLYIMESETEQDKPNATEPDMTGDIEFKNVTFGYEEGQTVLRDVSLTIPGGTTFGILGATGSGKSTLALLLARLYDLEPGCGEITVGGENIADMKARWVRKNVGIVLQEPFLFSRTIGENIGIAGDDKDMDTIRAAAKTACVDDAIMNFTAGYDTVVGERGVTLSGGQKQRTAIARMLMGRTPVMIFDDSLSAVDAETDAKIRHALKTELGGSTVILISHRITTLMQADKIAVFDKGRIAEMGSHEELMAKNGIYRRIYDLQMTLPDELLEEEGDAR